MFENDDREIPESAYRISSSTRSLMLGTAGFFDFLGLVQLIPLVGIFLGIFVVCLQWITFWLWFKTHRVNWMEIVFGKMGGRFVWKHIIPLVADTFLVAIPGFTINIFFVVEETRARDHAVAMGWVTEAEADLIEGFLAGNAGEILKGKIGKAEIEEAKHIAGIVGRRHIEEQREHVQRRILRNRRVQQLHSGLKEIETTTKRLGDRAAQARKYVDNIQPHNSEEPATIS